MRRETLVELENNSRNRKDFEKTTDLMKNPFSDLYCYLLSKISISPITYKLASYVTESYWTSHISGCSSKNTSWDLIWTWLQSEFFSHAFRIELLFPPKFRSQCQACQKSFVKSSCYFCQVISFFVFDNFIFHLL